MNKDYSFDIKDTKKTKKTKEIAMKSTHVISPRTGKTKFEVFVSETSCSNDGMMFYGDMGPLDCSIGSIFGNAKWKDNNTDTKQSDNIGLSVLIVDDSIIHRKLTKRILGGVIDEVMWMVEGAENGERAMQLVQASPRRPDVIIIDQNMESTGGRMLGHQVVELLRSDPAFDNVVIIGCTGMASTAKDNLLAAGCDSVWSKPMPSKTEAQAQIVKFLAQKRSKFNNLISMQLPVLSSPDTYELHRRHNECNELEESVGEDGPVFRQVKMARMSYKPGPRELVGKNMFPLDIRSMQFALEEVNATSA
eukprot:CAMPEP_0185025472 /NCGR_PEP_ID=MMETSP1103-20130426/8415_1 /TAXON_ID=36769 /ORGANISM="Paraphysomonas bandaiensis, Strain Caron Lab Isolate" /LENGTH=305 /DNA_ID=CAMNT_0027558675 /DNA_START=97 /DNA_END=1014 /DNA_ORIENTATION=+